MGENEQVTLDSGLLSQLTYLKNGVRDKFDGWFMIDGEIEGAGKSTLAAQICKTLDPQLDLHKQLVFTSDQFRTAVTNARPGQCIWWDEAAEGTNRAESIKNITQALKRFSEIIRKRRLFICLVRPYFWDFTSYFALNRTWFLITVQIRPDEKTQTFQRGDFWFYSRRRKHALYMEGLKRKDRYTVPPNFKGRFSSAFPFDEQLYDKLKEQAISSISSGKKGEIGNELLEMPFIHECFNRGLTPNTLKLLGITSKKPWYLTKLYRHWLVREKKAYDDNYSLKVAEKNSLPYSKIMEKNTYKPTKPIGDATYDTFKPKGGQPGRAAPRGKREKKKKMSLEEDPYEVLSMQDGDNGREQSGKEWMEESDPLLRELHKGIQQLPESQEEDRSNERQEEREAQEEASQDGI